MTLDAQWPGFRPSARHALREHGVAAHVAAQQLHDVADGEDVGVHDDGAALVAHEPRDVEAERRERLEVVLDPDDLPSLAEIRLAVAAGDEGVVLRPDDRGRRRRPGSRAGLQRVRGDEGAEALLPVGVDEDRVAHREALTSAGRTSTGDARHISHVAERVEAAGAGRQQAVDVHAGTLAARTRMPATPACAPAMRRRDDARHQVVVLAHRQLDLARRAPHAHDDAVAEAEAARVVGMHEEVVPRRARAASASSTLWNQELCMKRSRLVMSRSAPGGSTITLVELLGGGRDRIVEVGGSAIDPAVARADLVLEETITFASTTVVWCRRGAPLQCRCGKRF